MNTGFHVRTAEQRDAQAVAELWRSVFPNDKPWHDPVRAFARKIRRHDEQLLVGEFDGRIVAAGMAGFDGVRGWLYSLAVHPDYRRRGFGRQLVAEAERRLQVRGCPKINLQVRSDNDSVVAFYESLGYAVESRVSLGKPLPQGFAADPLEPVPTIPLRDGFELSTITFGDKAAYLEHLNDSDVFHRQLGQMPYPYTEHEADFWLMGVTGATLAGDRSRSWAIRNPDGELVGGCGLEAIVVGESAEIGYWLAQAYWGRGITTDAVEKVCEHAFRECKLQRIYANVFDFNTASARVLEKAGFQQEGLLRKHHFRDGEGIDVRAYGRLAETCSHNSREHATHK